MDYFQDAEHSRRMECNGENIYRFDFTIVSLIKNRHVAIVFFHTDVILVDCVTEFVPQDRLQIVGRHAAVRWSVYIFLLCAILLCGVFDAGQFIYVSF